MAALQKRKERHDSFKDAPGKRGHEHERKQRHQERSTEKDSQKGEPCDVREEMHFLEHRMKKLKRYVEGTPPPRSQRQ